MRERKKREHVLALLDPLVGQATVIVHCFLYASIFKSFNEQWWLWGHQVLVKIKTDPVKVWRES